jgi:drug/metabolite transporter (DMT)-like permease
MIIGVQPLLIAVLAAAVGNERMTKFGILGLAISFVGTLYLFGGNAGGAMSFDDMLRGGGLLLLSDAAWALYVVYSKPLLAKYGSFKITAWTLVLCAPPSLLFLSGSTLTSLVGLDSQAWFSLIFLSIIGTVICVVTWNYATPHLSATTMGASLYLIPVLAVVSGWFVLNEQVTGATVLAGILIMAGVAVAEFGNLLRSR